MHGTSEHSSPANGNLPRLLSIDQAAEQLGITRREVYRRIGLGEIEAVWLGRRRLVPLDEIDNFIKRLRAASAVRRSEVA